MALVKLGEKVTGSIVKIKVDGTPRNFIVVHKGRPSTLYDTSFEDTVWLLMEDIYTTKQWHSSNVNNYAGSTIHDWLNNTILNLIDSAIRDQIVQVKIPYRPGSGTSQTVNSGANGLSTKLFLLSIPEVGDTSLGSSSPVDGACLSYFSGTSWQDPKRIAYLNGIAQVWWLRSPILVASGGVGFNYACHINTSGYPGYSNCTSTLGIRPAFVLPASLFVTDDGFVTANQPPVISGSNTDLGTKTEPFDYKYTITDENTAKTITVTEKLTGGGITRTLRTYTAQLGTENTAAIPANWLYVQSGSNQLVITAADSLGESSTRAVTFTRQIGAIDAARAVSTSQKVTKCILSLYPAVQSTACTIEAQVTNNPFDTSPVWEDVSAKVGKYVHTFTNTVNTKGAGLGIRFRITPSASGGKVHIDSAVVRFE